MKIVRKPGPGAAQLKKFLEDKTDKVGKVGWFPASRYEDGTPVAYVAAIMEHGDASNNIPPRSFMRTTIAEKTPEWRMIARKYAKLIVEGKSTVGTYLEVIGLKGAGDIREKITLIREPPLKAATIAARLRKMADGKTVGNLDKPLVFTKLLLTSLNNTVEKK